MLNGAVSSVKPEHTRAVFVATMRSHCLPLSEVIAEA